MNLRSVARVVLGAVWLSVALVPARPASAETPFEAAMTESLDATVRQAAVRQAAELGDPAARYVLATMLEEGVGTEVDAAAARRWRLLAAGPAPSREQFELGMRHLRGDGMSHDPERASLWLGDAARQGHAGAQVALAGLLTRGDGVERDAAAAQALLRRAARRGSTEAAFQLALEVGLPDGEAWLREAASRGHPGANRQLGLALSAGGALATDEVAARGAFEVAAEAGDATAMLLAGLFHADGRGGAVDEERAYYWLRRARLNGEERGASRLVELERRLGVETKLTGDAAARPDDAPPIIPGASGGRVLPAAERIGHGTGFWLGTDTAWVLTNAHVVDSCSEMRFEDGAPLELVARVEHVDLALLRAPRRFAAGVALGPGPELGAPVTAPQVDGTEPAGRVRGLDRPGHDRRFFRFDARLERGASGGPVLDERGVLAGVTVAKLTPGAAYRLTGVPGQAAAFAVRGDVVADFLDAHGIGVSADDAGGDPAAAVVQLDCWL